MSNRRIALFLPSLANGGAERVMLNIANGLAEDSNLAIDLVLANAEGPYLRQVSTKVHLVNLNCGRIIFSLFPLIKYLQTNKPTAVLSALDTTNLVLIWASLLGRSSARIIVSVHCNFSSALKGAKNTRAKLLPWLVGSFYKFADDIIAVSQGVADDLVACTRVAKTDISVLVNPVITPELEDKSREPADHLWFSDTIPVVLAIGRLTYQKNFNLLLDSFAEATRKIPARLIILGEGEDLEKLQKQALELGIQKDVDFHGFVNNPYPFMRKCSVFVLSSLYEGLPTVLIEALYCGSRVISTDCPSGPSEILEKGKLGQLVPLNNKSLMAQAIVGRLLQSSEQPPKSNLSKYYLRNVVQAYRQKLLEE